MCGIQLLGVAAKAGGLNRGDIAMLKDIREVRINQLLGAMEPESRKRISPHLEPITLKLGAVVCEAGGLLKHAYFPQGSVLSLLTVLENGSAIETANIGREGAFGLFAAMYSRVSFNRCIVQLVGPWFAVRLKCCNLNSRLANMYAIFSSAFPRRYCHRSNRRSRATPCIQQRKECAVGSS